MRHTVLTFSAFLTCVTLSGQTNDTTFITVSQEVGAFEKQRFGDEYDRVFGTMVPARWAFKWYILGESDNGDLAGAASVEHKLSPSFSIQLGLGLGLINRYDTFPLILPPPFPDDLPAVPRSLRVFVYQLNLQPRWYYQMGKGVREGRSANNFSGNYLGLQLAYTHYGTNLSGEEARLASDQLTMALRWGWQRRLFRRGFSEVSFGIGARYSDGFDQATLQQRAHWDLYANTQFSFGLATFKPKDEKQDLAYCDALRCFRDEVQMLKIDLYNLLRIADKDNLKGAASLAYERKLGQSPFSVELLGYAGMRQEVSTQYVSEYNFSGWGFGGHVQPRFYFNLKKRIATGKSGNNLSGPYIALQTAFEHSNEERTQVAGNTITYFEDTKNAWNIGPLCGIQYRFFKNGFIDLNLGVVGGPQRRKGVQDGKDYTAKESPVRFTSSFRVGLAL
ncbi:MAG: hypothetical protein KIS77_03960 [Saprospiraceae bacterium]|nr:hypothetical protein [Saprospiraceae bacterium]